MIKLSSVLILATLCSICLAAQLPAAAQFCNANEDYFSGNCYEFVNNTTPLSYDDARAACVARGKILAQVPNSGVQSFLANSAEMRAWSRAMIGLHLRRDKWTWAKDGSLLYGQGCYADNTDRRDLNLSTQFMYNMKTGDCVDYCRTQPTARFAGVQAGRQCFCGSEYGSLPPTINCNTACGGDANAYCGGQGANYVYTIDGAYSSWQDGRPASDGGCGAMVLGQGSLFTWQDFPCSTRMAHICQFDEYSDVSEVSAYFCLYTTCYVLYDLQKPWYAARTHCQSLGGDLLKIDTIKVHSELVAMLSDHLYLGQVWTGASNGKWLWPDGSPLTFSSWSNYHSQPIVDSPIRTCAELSSAETNYNWVTRDCSALSGRTTFICQRKSLVAAADALAIGSAGSGSNSLQAGSVSAVVSDPQAQQTSSTNVASAYGVAWYGWLLIGFMIGLILCIITFTLIWAFCLRKPNRSSKLGSAVGSRSVPVTHIKTARREEAVTSSGIGSSVNSTTSSKPNSSSNRHHIDDTDNHPPATATVRPCGHEYNSHDVVTVQTSNGKLRVSSANRAPSQVENNRSGVGSSEEGGRRRSRMNSGQSRVAPTPGQGNNGSAPNAVDTSATPRDPFLVGNEDRA